MALKAPTAEEVAIAQQVLGRDGAQTIQVIRQLQATIARLNQRHNVGTPSERSAVSVMKRAIYDNLTTKG